MERRLNGPELLELRKLLQAAFQPEDFRDLLLGLDRSLDDYVGFGDNFPTALRKVLEAANAKLWWRDLLRAARQAVPADSGLAAFDGRFDVMPRLVDADGTALAPAGPQFELKIRDSGSTFDVGPWLLRAAQITDRVCRIEYPERTDRGTGFLVGPNLVLTNDHVIRAVREQPDLASTVVLRFDYKVADDGVSVDQGVVYRLAQPEWLAHFSESSPTDEQVPPAAQAPADKLDFAFLRVAGTPGADPAGGASDDPHRPRRGWIEAPVQDYDFATSPSLYIIQHPDGRPMRVALDTEADVTLNANGTRVRYTTTTEPGSSGSPCFGPDWEWIALHHMGDPKYQQGLRPEFNQGIPVNAIRALLAQQGKLDLLSGAPA